MMRIFGGVVIIILILNAQRSGRVQLVYYKINSGVVYYEASVGMT
uniref:Uncharacterized protein n=1 Tax=Bombyx mori TaxID=7091 RepID=Q8MTQ0_BOMMO|nr:putative protein [Bombyx mori]